MVGSHDEIRDDLKALGAALKALQRIPTAARRRLAMSWLASRMESDIATMRRDEHIERVADAVSAVLGEP